MIPNALCLSTCNHLQNPQIHIFGTVVKLLVFKLSKVIAKLCDAAGFEGQRSNHSLRLTAATHLFENNVSEHQIASLTGHRSVAVRNYQRISSDKQLEQSNVLYEKKCKTEPTSTVTSAIGVKPEDSSFDIRTLTQISSETKVCSVESVDKKCKVNYTPASVTVKDPVINLQQSKIIIKLVINVKSSDLVKNNRGQFVLLPIKVVLNINVD